MESKTLHRIKAFSTDKRKGNSLIALMDYCGVWNTKDVTEEQAREFLAKLESGEVTVGDY